MSWADLNLMPALPEIVLLIVVSAILIIDLFVKGERRGVTYLLSMLALPDCAQAWRPSARWLELRRSAPSSQIRCAFAAQAIRIRTADHRPAAVSPGLPFEP